MYVAVTHHRAQNSFDTALETAFHVGSVFQLGVVEIAPGGVGLRQQVTALIHQRNVTRRQTGYRTGDQVRDGADLPFIQRTARFEVNRHRGRRGLLFADKQGRLRHRQCTRALFTGPKVSIVRASSPSSARW